MLGRFNRYVFLHVEAKPYTTPEKTENHKRVALKKVSAALMQ